MDDEQRMRIARSVKAHRQVGFPTATALAEAAAITRQYLHEIEAGTANPSEQVISKLASALGIEPFMIKAGKTPSDALLPPDLPPSMQGFLLETLSEAAVALERSLAGLERAREHLRQSIMDPDPGFELRVVRVDSLQHHEKPSQEKTDILSEKIRKEELEPDGEVVQRDPIVIADDTESGRDPILLDGATRSRVWEARGWSNIIAQCVQLSDPNVDLQDWMHLCVGIDLSKVSDSLRQIFGDRVAIEDNLPFADLADAIEHLNCHSVGLHATGSGFAVRSSSALGLEDRSRLLHVLVDAYEDNTYKRRPLFGEDLEERARELFAHNADYHPQFQLLMKYKRFNKEEIRELAQNHILIPHGLSRFVLGKGRALRVNKPVQIFQGDNIKLLSKNLMRQVKIDSQRPFSDRIILLGEGD